MPTKLLVHLDPVDKRSVCLFVPSTFVRLSVKTAHQTYDIVTKTTWSTMNDHAVKGSAFTSYHIRFHQNAYDDFGQSVFENFSSYHKDIQLLDMSRGPFKRIEFHTHADLGLVIGSTALVVASIIGIVLALWKMHRCNSPWLSDPEQASRFGRLNDCLGCAGRRNQADTISTRPLDSASMNVAREAVTFILPGAAQPSVLPTAGEIPTAPAAIEEREV